jgi:hypothetical protein
MSSPSSEELPFIEELAVGMAKENFPVVLRSGARRVFGPHQIA